MTARSHRALPVRQWLGGLWVALACLLAGGGCATATYHATELPPQFAARPIDRLNKADLSRLTSVFVRSNQIGVGDIIEVEVYSDYGGGDTKPSLVNVAADGTANVPLIGKVKVDGMTPDEAQFAIADAAIKRDVIRTPHVAVRIEEQRKNVVMVGGGVLKPGLVELPRGNSTLLSAILAAGGLTDDASPDVTIRRPALSANTPDALRGNPLRVTDNGKGVILAAYEEGLPEQADTIAVDLVSASKDGNGAYYLDDGDVVHVKKRPERKIQVSGLVRNPGEFDMPPNDDLYLHNALALAGGGSTLWADRILVFRRVSGELEPITVRASIREVLKNRGNILLQENDVIIVEETPITVAFESLKTFFRFSIGSSLVLF